MKNDQAEGYWNGQPPSGLGNDVGSEGQGELRTCQWPTLGSMVRGLLGKGQNRQAEHSIEGVFGGDRTGKAQPEKQMECRIPTEC